MSANGSTPARKPVSAQDTSEALRAVRVAARWPLSPARWAEVGRITAAMLRAIADNDGGALQAGVGDLMVLGPVRLGIGSGGRPETEPASGDVLTGLTALIDTLTELTDLGAGGPAGDARDFPVSLSLPVTIYLRDGAGHELVERAVEDLVGVAGFGIIERDDPVIASWFRRMRAKLGGAARTPVGQAVLEAGVHRADLEFIQRPDAEVAALLLANVTPLLTALQPMGDTVIYLGVMLVVKADGMTLVYKLTPHQQLVLNNAPYLLKAPDKILQALGLAVADALPAPGAGGAQLSV
jgi:CATRA-Associated Small Protein